jgi:putative acetyltransferase
VDTQRLTVVRSAHHDVLNDLRSIAGSPITHDYDRVMPKQLSGFVVRRARADDAAGIRAVIVEAIRGSAAEFYSPEQIAAWSDPVNEPHVLEMIERTFAVVAVVADRVVGFSNLDGQEVDQLYVDPGMGGRGVARALYQAIEREAVARRLADVSATASLRAAPVFARFGFAVVERFERRYNGQTFAVVRVRKQLAGDPLPATGEGRRIEPH